MNRAAIHMHALRAAAAATGRATKHLSAAVAAASVLLSSTACAQPTPLPTSPPASDSDATAIPPSTADTNTPPDASPDTNAALIPWRACATAPDAAPDQFTWSIDSDACNLCPRNADPQVWFDCCEALEPRIDATCAAGSEPALCKEALFVYRMSHCTPWGPPAPPRWTGTKLPSLLPSA